MVALEFSVIDKRASTSGLSDNLLRVCGCLLFVVGVFKLFSLFHPIRLLGRQDIVFPWSYATSIWVAASVEILAALVVFLARSYFLRSAVVICVVGGLLSYRSLVYFQTGGVALCSCLGALADWFPLVANHSETISVTILLTLSLCSGIVFAREVRVLLERKGVALGGARSIAGRSMWRSLACAAILVGGGAKVFADSTAIHGVLKVQNLNPISKRFGETFSRKFRIRTEGECRYFIESTKVSLPNRAGVAASGEADLEEFHRIAFDGLYTYSVRSSRPPEGFERSEERKFAEQTASVYAYDIPFFDMSGIQALWLAFGAGCKIDGSEVMLPNLLQLSADSFYRKTGYYRTYSVERESDGGCLLSLSNNVKTFFIESDEKILEYPLPGSFSSNGYSELVYEVTATTNWMNRLMPKSFEVRYQLLSYGQPNKADSVVTNTLVAVEVSSYRRETAQIDFSSLVDSAFVMRDERTVDSGRHGVIFQSTNLTEVVDPKTIDERRKIRESLITGKALDATWPQIGFAVVSLLVVTVALIGMKRKKE